MNKLWLPLIILLAAINAALFWPGSLYFLNDDLLHIPLTDTGVFFQTNSIRPLHELLVKMDLLLWGKHAYGYHITALVLHFIVCIQLYDLYFVIQTNWLKVETSQAKNIAGLSVVLFLAYAGYSESIAWILGRTPVLSTVFFMFTMRLFFASKFSWSLVFVGAILFAAALFTYEQIILLPLIFLWLVFIDKDKSLKRWKYLYSAATIISAVAYVIARKLITSQVVGNYEGQSFVKLQIRNLIANAFRFMSRLWLNPGDTSIYLVNTIVLIIAAIAVLIFCRKKIKSNKNILIFFIGMMAILVLPILSLGISIHSFESGRYLYLPSLILVMIISMTAIKIFGAYKKLRSPISVLVLGLIMYWLLGKYHASKDYRAASAYVLQTHKNINEHFKASTDVFYIDSLKLTVHRIPVFRLGFKQGIKWLHAEVDTNKIAVNHFVEEDN